MELSSRIGVQQNPLHESAKQIAMIETFFSYSVNVFQIMAIAFLRLFLTADRG